jgi:hypothetical protein
VSALHATARSVSVRHSSVLARGGPVARLGSDLLAFLREHAPDVDDQSEIARFLSDGTLESHLGLIE